MPKKRPDREEQIASIVEIVRKSPAGARRSDIASALKDASLREHSSFGLGSTCRRWTPHSRKSGTSGPGIGSRYRLKAMRSARKPIREQTEKPAEVEIPISGESKQIRVSICSNQSRQESTLDISASFSSDYRPNTTFYLSPTEQEHTWQGVGTTKTGVEPAGTYAKQILSRLLIDCVVEFGSRLEGNTPATPCSILAASSSLAKRHRMETG